jgi:hypothetical protein
MKGNTIPKPLPESKSRKKPLAEEKRSKTP